MNHVDPELLLEAIQIITEHLLDTNDKLCGSTNGRKLQHLLHLLRKGQPLPSAAAVIPTEPLVARSVNLTIADDVRLATLADEQGVTRDHLIRSAVTDMLYRP